MSNPPLAMGPASTTNPEPTPPANVPTFPWIYVFVLLVLIAYPLSTGPVIKLIRKGDLPSEVVYIYAPLMVASSHSTAVEHFFNWYVCTVWKAR